MKIFFFFGGGGGGGGEIMFMSIFVWSGVPITTVVSCSLTNIWT